MLYTPQKTAVTGDSSIPDMPALVAKVCPNAVLGLCAQYENANQIRNTPIPNNNLHLDSVGRK